jgi:hypothetical protein
MQKRFVVSEIRFALGVPISLQSTDLIRPDRTATCSFENLIRPTDVPHRAVVKIAGSTRSRSILKTIGPHRSTASYRVPNFCACLREIFKEASVVQKSIVDL